MNLQQLYEKLQHLESQKTNIENEILQTKLSGCQAFLVAGCKCDCWLVWCIFCKSVFVEGKEGIKNGFYFSR